MLPRIDLRRLLLAGLLLLAVTSIAAWLVTRKPLPPVLRIATGAPGGQYHVFASELVEELEAVTGSRVEVVATPGSRENARLLFGGDVDLAIVQAAGVNLEGLVRRLLPADFTRETWVVQRQNQASCNASRVVFVGTGREVDVAAGVSL